MRLPRKAEEHLQFVLSYLDRENIKWQIEHGSKHARIVATVAGTKVSWHFSRTSSDHRAGLNFKSQVKRSVERLRSLNNGA